MAAADWWLVASSSLNGKPWDIITFQGTEAAARSAGLAIGGYPRGPYASAAAAVAAGKAAGTAVSNDPAASSGNPVTANENLAANSAKAAESSLAPWADSLTTFLGYLTSEGTWLRVAKVIVGSVMVIVGLAKITGADKAATAAAKGAIL